MRNYKIGFVLIIAILIMAGWGTLFPYTHATFAVNLNTAGNYVIMAETAIAASGTSSITGNIALSPAAASYITGFGLIMDSSGTFATSSLVSGKVYAANYAAPTPATLSTALSDMLAAYSTAAAQPTTSEAYLNVGAGILSLQTLSPGVYTWGTNLEMMGIGDPACIREGTCGGITLSGSSTDVWIFQIMGNLTEDPAVTVTLTGGATYNNVFWQVSGATTIEVGSYFQGIILDLTNIALQSGATLTGRALAQDTVTLQQSSTITAPTVTTGGSSTTLTTSISTI